MYDVGAVLPVRYDPDDRSKIKLDEPAMKATADPTRARVAEIQKEKADRLIEAGTESGVGAATASAIERKIELDKLHDSGALTDAAYESALAEIRADVKKYS